MNVILPCLRGNGKFWLKFEFIWDMGLEKDTKILGYRGNGNRIHRAAEEILLSVPQNKVKQTKPRMQAKNRIFVLLNSAPKSPKISSAALRKAHPAVRIRQYFLLSSSRHYHR